jgi:asparagine synthase (glutamine-hydrolysing)
MCGIGGAFNLSKNNKNLSKDNINIIRKILRDRGPDSDKIWISKKKDVALTIQRLATQDKRTIANQPCFSNDRSMVLIMNGEIYNHRELKKTLIKKNYKFLSNNDAEVAVNAYHFWGENFLNKLDGQFAIFALNTITNEGLIARDRHGIAPLYFSLNKKRFFFSSSPESLHKQLKLKIKISKKGFADFMVSSCLTENNTFFEQIKYLSPGNFIKFKINKFLKKPKPFISNKEKTITSANSTSATVKKIGSTLYKSVGSRLSGDKKVGIFLSGGIDSILLLSMYKKLYPNIKIKTFTAVFENAQTKALVGEHKNVKKICKFYKSKNYLVKIRSADLVNYLETSSYPSCGILEYSFKKLGEVSKKNKTDVILSGEGADEMFCGYDHNLALIGIFKKKFSFLKKKYKLRSLQRKKLNLSSLKIEDLFLIGGADIDFENNRKKIFSPQILKTRSFRSTIIKTINKYNLKNPQDVDKIIVKLDYDIKIPEVQIRRAEDPVMSNGVEMRFPYLNNELINQVQSTNLNQKIHKNNIEKILLRKIAKNYIPKRLIQPKLPFGLPAIRKKYYKKSDLKFNKPAFNNFFFDNYKKVSKMVLNGKHRKLNFINSTFLENIVFKQSKASTCFFDPVLWKIWSFAEWFERMSKKHNEK